MLISDVLNVARFLKRFLKGYFYISDLLSYVRRKNNFSSNVIASVVF